jgi:hypothetical protein
MARLLRSVDQIFDVALKSGQNSFRRHRRALRISGSKYNSYNWRINCASCVGIFFIAMPSRELRFPQRRAA